MKRLNVVLKYIKKHPTETVFKKLKGKLRICAISDSAFKRQDESPLACRGSMITLGTDSPDNPGGKIHVIDYQSHDRLMEPRFMDLRTPWNLLV